MDAYKKACRELEKEIIDQCYIGYSAAVLALKRNWGWGKKRITNLLGKSQEIWMECAGDVNKSMIQMLDEETGIEIQNGDGKSWKDLAYLNSKINTDRMTKAMYIYMRREQKKWAAPQVMACLLLALHRREGFGYDRCQRFVAQVDEIKAQYKDTVTIRKAALEETRINITETVK